MDEHAAYIVAIVYIQFDRNYRFRLELLVTFKFSSHLPYSIYYVKSVKGNGKRTLKGGELSYLTLIWIWSSSIVLNCNLLVALSGHYLPALADKLKEETLVGEIRARNQRWNIWKSEKGFFLFEGLLEVATPPLSFAILWKGKLLLYLGKNYNRNFICLLLFAFKSYIFWNSSFNLIFSVLWYILVYSVNSC